MGETAKMAEAATSGDLAHLLAEATAGLPGAEQRLAAHLRPSLEALLRQRLTGAEPMCVADAGQLVQWHWQQLARPEDSPDARAADAATDAGAGVIDGRGTGPGRKGAAGGKARKGAKGAKGARGAMGAKDAGASGANDANGGQGTAIEPRAPATDPATADAAASPLFASFVEQAAAVMQGLVREAAFRGEPHGPAQRALLALEALESLDPPLARVARLRWFAGLDDVAAARLLGEGEPEARRRWLKARAYLSAATKDTAAPSP
ncbi:MAG: hypothetical protein HZC37_19135 [Burkholderiales bacterium]|nr:hypothetical protein [Burkholderiales bacterium]